MNGELIGFLGEAIVNLAVSAEIGVLGDYPEYAAMQRRVLRHGGFVLDRIEQWIEIVCVENRYYHRGVRFEQDRSVSTVAFIPGGTHYEHISVFAFAIQHIDIAGSSPYQEEAKIADRALLRFKELLAIAAHYAKLYVNVTVSGRELYTHPLLGHDICFTDGIFRNGDVVQRLRETELGFRRKTRVKRDRQSRRGVD